MLVDRFALRRFLPTNARLATMLLGAFGVWPITPLAAQELDYLTLDFDGNQTFLTGIRGDNIVGNYIVPNSTATGGLLYRADTGIWSPFPVETPSGTNFPDATTSSPYGPSFGSQYGILRVVGSYQTDSSPGDLSYLYDGASAPGESLLTLVYPGSLIEPTLNTIAHSTFGNTIVGNYDTQLATGNAFIYDIPTGAYTANNKPGEISTTAYGVWADKIAGGYGAFGPDGEPGFEHGYIYDVNTDVWTTYDHPGAFFTHFEGITGAGRGGEYNLVADWIDGDGLHGSVLHVDADGNETWIPIEVPGAATTTANSIFEDKVIGVYTDVNGAIHGFEVTVPGIYNPIRNAVTIDTSTPDIPAISAGEGDDVVNDGVIRTSGALSSGIRSERYGVITNNGTIDVTGAGSAAVEMHGAFGTLLNGGTISAATGADAIRAKGSAEGTTVVNYGVIDGRVAITAGPDARFENSGWLGISDAGAGTTHVISGTFAQTSAGALALRIDGEDNDTLSILGSARLAGTVVPIIQPGDLARRYTILTATDELTGKFDELAPLGLPSFFAASLDYSDTKVKLELEAQFAKVSGETRNQRAVGVALDHAFNSGGGIPDGLEAALFGLSEKQVPAALDGLSGEIYASEQSVLINQAMFAREVLLGRLRRLSYADPSEPLAALGYAEAPAIIAGTPRAAPGLTFWAQGLGAWSEIDGDSNASAASGSFAGIIGGADTSVGDNWRIGSAFGYSHSSTGIDALKSSAEADTGLLALYASGSRGAWKLRTGGAYAMNFVDTRRTVNFPGFTEQEKADYNVGAGQLFGEIGYGTTVQGIPIEPFAGLAWVGLDTDDFKETGGAAALAGSSNSTDMGFSSLGIRAATSYLMANGMVVEPRLSLAWQHAFDDVTPSAALAFDATTGANFTVDGVPIARDSALINAGVDLLITTSAKLELSYFGQLASKAYVNAVQGNLTFEF